ncbi:Uu.00g012720.m01.CDS01 [Anthostomella pinea]|uniref:Uu.00g012720.m01.CDS01 n=1 Tax=Anthostomella pinea TaxID=933095 RepID=A0AAI8VZ82_9PEZI|nr:Uu.00g012720.m01.CDS01 [Anthostomella pinea]
MVVRTPPLSSLKRGFLPQIHHPLPLSKRESQHLLESITTSFRKNLDKEHPWQHVETTSHTPSTPSTTTSKTALLPNTPISSHRPTDRHLRAILSNPLFSHSHDVAQPTALTNTKNPFDVFDSAVHRGLMNVRRAAGFLAAVRSHIVAQSPHHVRQRMAQSGAGLHVIQWLRASGQENDLHFLSDGALIKCIIPFMYAEGLQEVIWVWLARLAAQMGALELEKTPGKVSAPSLAKLVAALMKETSESGSDAQVSLDNSYSALSRANELLSPAHSRAAAASIRESWVNLSWASTVNGWQRPKPSAPLFDSFLELGQPFKLQLDLAHLELHHPTTPSHSAAVEYMRLKHQVADDVADMHLTARSQRRMICLALDAADRLKQVGNTDEASLVERFLTKMCESVNLGMLNLQGRDSFASELPIRHSLLR